MKKYKLGALSIESKGLYDNEKEIVADLISKMQQYVAEAQKVYESANLDADQKLIAIQNISGRFCGLSDFMNLTMGVDARDEKGRLYTSWMYSHFFAWEQAITL